MSDARGCVDHVSHSLRARGGPLRPPCAPAAPAWAVGLLLLLLGGGALGGASWWRARCCITTHHHWLLPVVVRSYFY